MQQLRSALRAAALRYVTVSLKSLAVWRVALGATCVHSVVRRWTTYDVFYSETGAYPVASLTDRATWQLGPLATLPGGLALQAAFAACLLVTVAFTIGFGTRVVKWLLLPVLIALDARPPVLFTGGEQVLHLQALYVVLLPVGAVLSVDAWRRTPALGQAPDRADQPTATRSLAYPLLLLQLAVIYSFNALAKSGDSWRDGSAVARALGAATLVSEQGAWIARLPTPILQALTYGTLIIEGALPFLILSPWVRRKAHALAALLIVALHGGILLAMEVGSFSAAMMCHVPLLLHPRGMEARIEPRSTRAWRVEAIAVVGLLYLLAARLSQDLVLFPGRPRLPMPAQLEVVTRLAGLQQGWMMFSPDPPARDFIIVTDATTRSGRHYDPWRKVASGEPEPFTQLPASVVRSHLFTRYENFLSNKPVTTLHPFFARWVLSQRLAPQDPVERFDAWLMVISTDPEHVVPLHTLEARVGVARLAVPDALPVRRFEARGVWAPERAFDRKIAPEGTHVYTPVSATMSAGCPQLTLDLGQAHKIQTAFVQAGSTSRFFLDGSLDGAEFRLLVEIPSVTSHHLASRIITLPGDPVRFVRVRPTRSRAMTHILSELALFDHPVTLPPLVSRPSEVFLTSLERPSVVGIVSGSNHPSPDCPAEKPQFPPPAN